MKKQDIFDNYDKYILNTYSRMPGIFVKGKGMNLIDISGKKYLDFFPGWGVSSIGHCHPKVMAAVRDQIGKLIHIPNNLYHQPQVRLAREIIRASFPGKVFFCNSGTEASEAAIKFARAYGHKPRRVHGHEPPAVQGQRYEIITMQNSFHGRTLGALTATGQEQYKQGFGPLLEGFKTVPFNDTRALENAINAKTVAVMLELVQGEGGVNIAKKKYIQRIREICDEKDILLIFDEVQTGMGRTGEMFCFKHFQVTPDLMILAKALGGGLPIGALVAKESIAATFQPGMHASTFGGSPLVSKAALGVFKAINAGKMLKNTKILGTYALKQLEKLKQKFHCITEVRGLGLMIAICLNIKGAAIVNECFRQGLIINCTQGTTLRIMPALNVTKKQMDKALYILEKVIKEVTSRGGSPDSSPLISQS